MEGKLSNQGVSNCMQMRREVPHQTLAPQPAINQMAFCCHSALINQSNECAQHRKNIAKVRTCGPAQKTKKINCHDFLDARQSTKFRIGVASCCRDTTNNNKCSPTNHNQSKNNKLSVKTHVIQELQRLLATTAYQLFFFA